MLHAEKKKKIHFLPRMTMGKTRSLSIEFVTPGERRKEDNLWMTSGISQSNHFPRTIEALLRRWFSSFDPSSISARVLWSVASFFGQGQTVIIEQKKTSRQNSGKWKCKSTKLGLIQRISRWLATERESDCSLTISKRMIRTVIPRYLYCTEDLMLTGRL